VEWDNEREGEVWSGTMNGRVKCGVGNEREGEVWSGTITSSSGGSKKTFCTQSHGLLWDNLSGPRANPRLMDGGGRTGASGSGSHRRPPPQLGTPGTGLGPTAVEGRTCSEGPPRFRVPVLEHRAQPLHRSLPPFPPLGHKRHREAKRGKGEGRKEEGTEMKKGVNKCRR
jgi:hypothetical protein